MNNISRNKSLQLTKAKMSKVDNTDEYCLVWNEISGESAWEGEANDHITFSKGGKPSINGDMVIHKVG
jgi:hypothetical protein